MNAPPPTPEQTLEDDEDEEDEEEEEKGYSREKERKIERGGGNPCVTLGRESRSAAQKRGGEFRREKYLRGF